MARKLFSQGQGKRETIEKIKSDNFRGPFTGPLSMSLDVLLAHFVDFVITI